MALRRVVNYVPMALSHEGICKCTMNRGWDVCVVSHVKFATEICISMICRTPTTLWWGALASPMIIDSAQSGSPKP